MTGETELAQDLKLKLLGPFSLLCGWDRTPLAAPTCPCRFSHFSLPRFSSLVPLPRRCV